MNLEQPREGILLRCSAFIDVVETCPVGLRIKRSYRVFFSDKPMFAFTPRESYKVFLDKFDVVDSKHVPLAISIDPVYYLLPRFHVALRSGNDNSFLHKILMYSGVGLTIKRHRHGFDERAKCACVIFRDRSKNLVRVADYSNICERTKCDVGNQEIPSFDVVWIISERRNQ